MSGWAGASSLHAGEGGTSVRYKGMVDCFARTWQEEGYRAFFKVPPAHLPLLVCVKSVCQVEVSRTTPQQVLNIAL